MSALRPTPGRRLLLRGGRVHSPADPRATALLVVGDTVAWVGDETVADTLEADEVVDLAGDLLVPAFVDVTADPSTAVDAASRGVVVPPARPVLVDVADPDREQVVRAARDAGRRVALVVTDVDLSAADAATLVEVSRTADGVVVRGAVAFAGLLAAGVPLAVAGTATHPAGPWGLLAEVGRAGVAPRAAFRAATRAPWRLLGLAGRGELRPGAVADVARVRCGPLVLSAPDDRVARWSTDPRGQVPGLPRADEPPEPLGLVVATPVDA